jgi:hypothetical protein
MEAFITANDTWQVIATTALGVLIAFGLWTLLLALLPAGEGRRAGMLRLKQADGGMVEVTSQSLERLVRDELEALPEVRQAVPRVRVSGGSVDTDILAVIEPQESIAHVTAVIGDTVRRAFKEQVGVTNVKRPNIRISYEPVKGRPVVEGGRPQPTRPIAPPSRNGEEDAVNWPPPPDVSRPEAEAEDESTTPWPSNREPGATTQTAERSAETATEREEQ